MKKILFLLVAGSLAYSTYAQTQRVNRTRTRPHNAADTNRHGAPMRNDPTRRMAPENDQDRNNPNQNTNRTNTNGTRTNTVNTNTQTGNGR